MNEPIEKQEPWEVTANELHRAIKSYPEFAHEIKQACIAHAATLTQENQRLRTALEDLSACQPEADMEEWRRARDVANEVLYGKSDTAAKP